MISADARARESSSGGAEPRTPPDVHPTVGATAEQFPGYEVRGELGRGGMGVVYRAFDRRRGEVVALKTLLWGDPAALYRFKQEFRSFADLSHSNLVSLYELVSDGRAWFFTMELVDGEPILDWVRADRARLRPALAQLVAGLGALHGRDRVHRDVKPSNVLVARDGRVVLLDFGLAAELAADGLHRSTKTHVLGTVGYMSPEQASGRPVSSASDLYSVGVLLFESLTGRLPFEGDAVQILVDKRSREAPRASACASDVPADLDVLCAELLSRDPAMRPAAADVARRLEQAAGTRPGGEPASELDETPPARSLVGRDEHLAALDGALRSLAAGRPIVALVHGASGMGKSALVQTFVDEIARPRGAVVLAGRCYERESVPYKAFDSAMDALARHLARLPRLEAETLLPRDVGALTRVFPALRRAEAVAAAPQGAADVSDPAELRRRAFAALRELFGRMADRRPLVVWSDDLQWGDVDSADLVAALLRPPDPPALLFVGSYRREDAAASPFLSAALASAGGLAERVEVRVDPLDERDAEELAARLTGGDSGRAASVARESRGNPFFVHELAEFGAASAAGQVTLDAVVADRVSRLAPDARNLLEAVAVSGGPLPLSAALQAAGVDSGARAAVAALRSGRLVRLVGSSATESVDTYHDRIRETVIQRVPPDDLSERHRRLGLALEMSRDADPEKLAVHFQGGGEAARAGMHFERAAAKAAAALAFEHAARLYRLAIEHLAPRDDERRQLLTRLADCLAAARRGTHAAETYLEASRGAPEAVARELCRLAGEQYLTAGRIDEAVDVLEPIVPSIRSTLDAPLVRAVPRLLWKRARLRFRGLSFRERPEGEIDPAGATRCDTLATLAACFSQVDIFGGMTFQCDALRASLGLGEPSRLARQLGFEFAYRLGVSGRLAPHDVRLLETAKALAARTREESAMGYVVVFEGITGWFQGRWAESIRRLHVAEERLRKQSTGASWALNMVKIFELMALDFAGELADLRPRLATALADAEARADHYLRTDLETRVVHLVRLAGDDPTAGEAGIRAAVAAWSRRGFHLQHYRAEESLTHIALYRGDVGGALREIAAWGAGGGRSGHFHVSVLWSVFHTMRGRANLLAGATPGPSRERHLAVAARTGAKLARNRVAYARLWGELLLAGVESVRGDAAACVRRLETTERAFADAGMKLYSATCRRRRGQLAGGDAGRALVAEADAVFAAEGIARPDRWADMYAPGKWE